MPPECVDETRRKPVLLTLLRDKDPNPQVTDQQQMQAWGEQLGLIWRKVLKNAGEKYSNKKLEDHFEVRPKHA